MSAGDELASLLWEDAVADRARDGLSHIPVVRSKVEAAADAILAAGYRKPGVIEPENMRIENGYLVAEVKGCTCGGGGPECNYAHENGCGLEPLADITDALHRSGYVKPRRISTTAEVDALPDGAVVMTVFGNASTILRNNPHLGPEDFHYLVDADDDDYATVLWEPSA